MIIQFKLIHQETKKCTANKELEFQKNTERFAFLNWGAAFHMLIVRQSSLVASRMFLYINFIVFFRVQENTGMVL